MSDLKFDDGTSRPSNPTALHSPSKKLKDWQQGDIERISNNLDYTYVKGFSRKFNGLIKTMSGEPLLSFKRTDTGMTTVSSRIEVVGSSFHMVFDKKPREVLLNYNGNPLGRLVQYRYILNNEGHQIGYLQPVQNTRGVYELFLNRRKMAIIIQNSDRREFVKNPFYRWHSAGVETEFHNQAVVGRNVSYSNMIKLYQEPSEMEYQWALAIVCFDIVFNGLDFTM